jgi:hypothetical protein
MQSLEQQRYSFNDQYLAALLQVYRDYYPDIIVSDFRRAKSSVFRVQISSRLPLTIAS